MFSSPSFTNKGLMICGSHDSHVYCITESGLLKWKYKTKSAVFSSPYVMSFCNIHNMIGGAVIACDTSGFVYVINVEDGSLLSSVCLPGEVYSSPLFCDDKFVVGCRNDEIYCFRMS